MSTHSHTVIHRNCQALLRRVRLLHPGLTLTRWHGIVIAITCPVLGDCYFFQIFLKPATLLGTCIIFFYFSESPKPATFLAAFSKLRKVCQKNYCRFCGVFFYEPAAFLSIWMKLVFKFECKNDLDPFWGFFMNRRCVSLFTCDLCETSLNQNVDPKILLMLMPMPMPMPMPVVLWKTNDQCETSLNQTVYPKNLLARVGRSTETCRVTPTGLWLEKDEQFIRTCVF